MVYSVSGLEAGKFIPSVTMLNGFRMGKQRWEIAVGPTFRIMNETHDIPDPKGDPKISSGLVIAAGRSFKSGSLNIPVNAYIIPRRNAFVAGVSVGFNIYREKKAKTPKTKITNETSVVGLNGNDGPNRKYKIVRDNSSVAGGLIAGLLVGILTAAIAMN
jgi:hypothetical protein